MKQFLLTVFLLVVLAASAGALSPELIKAHKASHQIGQEVLLLGGRGCTATAIGPQALLTATHCEMPTDVLYVRGVEYPATIVGRIRDENDHTIYLLQNIHFADYIDVSLTDPKEQGEDVFVFGNPGAWSDQFRKGYITGVKHDESLAGALGVGMPDMTLFDLNTWHGDSGSAILNANGKIIAVLSTGEGQVNPSDPSDNIVLTGAFVFAFKQGDLDRARGFSIANSAEYDKRVAEDTKKDKS